MTNIPKKCVVDTNVPITANQAINPESIPVELSNCVMACISVVEYVVQKGILVIDSCDEIFDEYKHKLSFRGQPGIGDKFLKWVHDNKWNEQRIHRVIITKNEHGYNEFPESEQLQHFDNDDRKFVAVANKHPEKPPIIEATDSDWWGWKEILANLGIKIVFVCPNYVKSKYEAKNPHGLN